MCAGRFITLFRDGILELATQSVLVEPSFHLTIWHGVVPMMAPAFTGGIAMYWRHADLRRFVRLTTLCGCASRPERFISPWLSAEQIVTKLEGNSLQRYMGWLLCALLMG